MTTTAEKRAAFRALHEQGCFVLPNPWDRGTARYLAHRGFAALATTSSGAAWSRGRPDGSATRDEALDHLADIVGATDLPVNADFEDGYGDTADEVAASVALAIETGVAGLSIEDGADGTSYELHRTVSIPGRAHLEDGHETVVWHDPEHPLDESRMVVALHHALRWNVPIPEPDAPAGRVREVARN